MKVRVQSAVGKKPGKPKAWIAIDMAEIAGNQQPPIRIATEVVDLGFVTYERLE